MFTESISKKKQKQLKMTHKEFDEYWKKYLQDMPQKLLDFTDNQVIKLLCNK